MRKFILLTTLTASISFAQGLRDVRPSVYVDHFSKILPLSTPGDRFHVSKTESGFQGQVQKCGILIFNRNSTATLLGDGSESLEAGYGLGFDRSFHYDSSSGVKVADIWERLPMSKQSRVVLPIKLEEEPLSFPAEILQKFLSTVARDHQYTLPQQTFINHTRGSNVYITEDLFDFFDEIDLRALFEEIKKFSQDPEFRTKIDALLKQADSWLVTYRELARSYLEAWTQEHSLPPNAQHQASIQMELDVSLQATAWDLNVESQERGFYIAFPIIPVSGLGNLQLGVGFSEKMQYAVFRITGAVGVVDGNFDFTHEVYSHDGNELLLTTKRNDQYRQVFPLPFDLRSHPFYLQSPRRTYRLAYVGLGFYRDDKTQLEFEVAFNGEGLEQMSTVFNQRISNWLLVYLGTEYAKIGSRFQFLQTNIPEEIYESKEIDRLNQDLVEKGYLLAISRLKLGALVDDTKLELLDIVLAGPSLWYKGGIETDISDWLLEFKMLKYFCFMKGKSNDLKSINLGVLGLGQYEIEGKSKVGFLREQWTFYRLGVGHRFGNSSLNSYVDLSNGKARHCGLGVCFTGPRIFERNGTIDVILGYDLGRERLEGVAFKFNLLR